MKTEIIAMPATGISMAKIANELRISTGVVCRVVNETVAWIDNASRTHQEVS